MMRFDNAILKRFGSVLKSIPLSLARGQYFRVAAALAFSTVLAMVPLMTVLFSALSLFPIFEVWTGSIQDFLYKNLLPQSGDQIQVYLQEFSANAGQLTILGLVFLMVTTLALLATIEDAFNDIWQVKNGRPFGQRIVIYWAMLTLGPILIAMSLSMSSYLLSLSIMQDQLVVDSFKDQLLSILPFLLVLIAFVFFYYSVPNCEVRFVHALIGGAAAAIFFELTKFGFTQYVLNFPSYQLIYGALAVLPVFLIWLYLSWLVVLIGAYITAAFGYHARDPEEAI